MNYELSKESLKALNEVLENNKVVHVHSNTCKDNHDCDCKIKYDSPWFYEFEYLYESHLVLVHPCVSSFEGIPHLFILDEAISIINEERGIKSKCPWRNVYTTRDSYLQTRKDYGKKNKTVYEVIATGGFNTTYYVEHEISDLNVDDLLNQEVKLWSNKWNNLYHLGRVISRAKANILVNNLSKIDKKNFNKYKD